jgi:glutathione synthase/RimK-type ligase-like ATP-grasp enzyme
VLPSVSTINELRDTFDVESSAVLLSRELDAKALPDDINNALVLDVYFGWTSLERLQKFARKIYERYTAPILRLFVWQDANGVNLKVENVAFSSLTEDQKGLFIGRMQIFTQTVWRSSNSKKQQRWDMAILVNPDEPHPPSDKEAISRFIRAAAKTGIQAQTVHAQQLHQLSQYDALFIRETTAIDHHTYKLARKAERAGLIVMDDPSSILRCCNKVFLHDAFSYNHVPALKTKVLTGMNDEDIEYVETEFSYPIILKMPEGSFSKGVFKVENRSQLKEKLQYLFQNSALVLVQEYLYTEYDWRIGVLNGRAIYACKYLMARNHWQIYNHGAKRFSAGGFETLPTFEVPKAVLDAAVKAGKIVGKGLYGVDLKLHGNHVYVIEVNDNPSLDYGVEDEYLGNELYMQIMTEFAQRLENRGR